MEKKVKELEKIEKKDFPVKSAEEMLVDEFEELSRITSKRNKLKKLLLKAGVIVLGIIVLSILGLVFKLDAYIFPSSVNGIITDFANRPLEGVSVCVSIDCAITDNMGYFNLSTIKYGNYTVTVNMERYHEINEDIYVQRGINEYNRQLQPYGFGEIKGVLGSSDEVIIEGMELRLDDEMLLINEDMSFNASEKMIGKYVLSFTSPYYKDFETEVNVTEGVMDLGEVLLDDSRDIEFIVKDYVNELVVQDVKITINEIELKTTSEGTAKFTDLDLSLSYSYNISKDGYNPKAGEISIEDTTSLYPLQELNLVRSGKIVYTSSRTGNYNVYSSDFDGSNEKVLSDNRGNNFSPELLTEGTVLFLSTRDGVKDAYNQPVALLYKVNLDGTGLTKVSRTNYEDHGSIGTYSVKAQRRAYIKYNPDGLQELYFGNIDGTYMAMIYSNASFTGGLHDLLIAPDGRSILLSLSDSTSGTMREYLVRINTESGVRTDLVALNNYSYTRLVDIASDKALVISSGFGDPNYDIYGVDLLSGTHSQFTTNTISEIKAYYSPDLQSIYYYDSRDLKTDLYVKRAPSYQEERLTSSGKIGGIVYIKDDLLFYIEENKLKVLDPQFPSRTKEVTSNVTNYSYYWD